MTTRDKDARFLGEVARLLNCPEYEVFAGDFRRGLCGLVYGQEGEVRVVSMTAGKRRLWGRKKRPKRRLRK